MNAPIPLSLQVIYHSDYSKGEYYLNKFYSTFSRPIENPLIHGIGIPISVQSFNENLLDFKLASLASEFKVFIVLVDTKMVLSENWNGYLQQLAQREKDDPKSIILPVAVDDSFTKLIGDFPILQFIRFNEKETLLFIELTQAIARLLYQTEKQTENSPPRLKIFLSYARHDGKAFAECLRNYIRSRHHLDTFFDSNDISRGYRFNDELDTNIKNSILLSLHTDIYSSREWCQWEVIQAKQYNRPIVVINAFKAGEQRSFPYMANVPNIKLSSKVLQHIQEFSPPDEEYIQNDIDLILKQVLIETLRFKYQELRSNYLLQLHDIDSKDAHVINTPPELFSILHLKDASTAKLIYPDPPIGIRELKILNQFNSNIQFLTPTTLAFAGSKALPFKEDFKIGISISESHEVLQFGMTNFHLQDAMVEFARYFLVSGATLVYGGDLRYDSQNNFVLLLDQLIRTYQKDYGVNEKVINFVPYPFSENLTDGEKVKFLKSIKFKLLALPPNLKQHEKGKHNSSIGSRYLIARSLTFMREKMNKTIQARVIIGGKTKGFTGRYPGLIEEAFFAINDGKPIYLIGGFGGQALKIIQALKGEKTEAFTLEFQRKNKDFSKLYDYYVEHLNDDEASEIDYDSLFHFFAKKGIHNLSNGLNQEENEQLFHTKDISEMVRLVLKGLSKISIT